MKKYWISLLLSLWASLGFSQLILKPYIAAPEEKKSKNKSAALREGPITLPFFDEFHTGNVPSNDLWISKGVVLTNQLAPNPPSYGVATLDSYDENGRPYDLSSQQAEGYSDTLMSHPIDLSVIPVGSNDVYLSFFWQAQGLGEQPDPTDFLRLEAKAKGGTWQTLWQQPGEPAKQFTQEILSIVDSFYHDQFQFRFIRYGRNSGNFDVWHLDYIYLNQNRNPNQTTYDDIATVNIEGSYLKKYRAMPLSQFLVDPAAEISDTVAALMNNLDSEDFRNVSYRCTLIDTLSKTVYGNIATIDPTSFVQVRRNVPEKLYAKPINVTPPPAAEKVVLKYQFETFSSDNDESVAPFINYRRNDTIRGFTVLDNYFAYDDGSAEYVAGINQQQGRLALRYELKQPAQLTHIDISFVPFLTDLRSQTFVLSVWKNINLGERTDVPVFQKSYQVAYPDSVNGFVRFDVATDRSVVLDGEFYIGIQQTTDDFLAIGFDRNTNAQAETFFNVAGLWEQDATVKGSLMMRPVFGPAGTVTTLPSELSKSGVSIFPNPAREVVYISSKQKIKEVKLCTVQGLEVRVDWDASSQQINMAWLPAGIYWLFLTDWQGQTTVHRLLKL